MNGQPRITSIAFAIYLDVQVAALDRALPRVARALGFRTTKTIAEVLSNRHAPGRFAEKSAELAADETSKRLLYVVRRGQAFGLTLIEPDTREHLLGKVLAAKLPRNRAYALDQLSLREWQKLPRRSLPTGDPHLRAPWGVLSRRGQTDWIIDAVEESSAFSKMFFEQQLFFDLLLVRHASQNLYEEISRFAGGVSVRGLGRVTAPDAVRAKLELLRMHQEFARNVLRSLGGSTRAGLSKQLEGEISSLLAIAERENARGQRPQPQKGLRVFICSSRGGLDRRRLQLRDALLANGFFPVMMEYFPSLGLDSPQACVEVVRSCDAFVLLLGGRLGYVPPNQRLSMTQLEWSAALDKSLPTVTVLFEGTAQPDEEPESTRAQQNLGRWKSRLSTQLNIRVNRQGEPWLSRVIQSLRQQTLTIA